MVTEAARDCFIYQDEVVAASNVYQRLHVAFRPRGLQINTPPNDTNYSRYWFAFHRSFKHQHRLIHVWKFDSEEEEKKKKEERRVRRAVSFLLPFFFFIYLSTYLNAMKREWTRQEKVKAAIPPKGRQRESLSSIPGTKLPGLVFPDIEERRATFTERNTPYFPLYFNTDSRGLNFNFPKNSRN